MKLSFKGGALLCFLAFSISAAAQSSDGWIALNVPTPDSPSGRTIHVLLPAGYELRSDTVKFSTTYVVDHAGTDPDAYRKQIKDTVFNTQNPAIIVDTGIRQESPAEKEFLRKSLIPYIESHYQADPEARILMGAGNESAKLMDSESASVFSSYVQLNSAKPSFDARKNYSLPKAERVAYWSSVGILAASQVCDIASSQPIYKDGKLVFYEKTGMFQDKNGAFSNARAIPIKIGIFGGGVALEKLAMWATRNKSPKTRKFLEGLFTAGNIAAAVPTFAVCKSNIDIRDRINSQKPTPPTPAPPTPEPIVPVLPVSRLN